MGLEGGFGMALLALTFDVESVVFLRRGSHFLVFYGAGGSVWDGNVRIQLQEAGFHLIPYSQSVVQFHKCLNR